VFALIKRTLLIWWGWGGWLKLGAMGTVLTAVAALWFSAQSLLETQKQYSLTERGQLDERFSRSIEQLGSDKPDIELGAIYSLERLAHDSEVDRPVVMQVLAAYLRSHAPNNGDCKITERDPVGKPIQREEVRAAFEVITQREGRDGVNLDRTCLVGAVVIRGNLRGVELNGANLSEAVISETDLTDALLLNATLAGAQLIYADMTGLHMPGSDFRYAFLSRVRLEGAWLKGADLTGADLSETDLQYATLSNANLTGADLEGADLTHAFALDANLTDANLSGANLTGAKFSNATLDGANLTGITYTADTTDWPAGFNPPPSTPRHG
jgi:uncharacterized protein YjbI with pentapeptide repeats